MSLLPPAPALLQPLSSLSINSVLNLQLADVEFRFCSPHPAQLSCTNLLGVEVLLWSSGGLRRDSGLICCLPELKNSARFTFCGVWWGWECFVLVFLHMLQLPLPLYFTACFLFWLSTNIVDEGGKSDHLYRKLIMWEYSSSSCLPVKLWQASRRDCCLYCLACLWRGRPLECVRAFQPAWRVPGAQSGEQSCAGCRGPRWNYEKRAGAKPCLCWNPLNSH